MTRRQITDGIAVVLLLATIWPATANAHVLKIDGSIGAVLHINPDDNPTTHNSTDYIISFSDDTGRFSLLQCNCAVSILEHSKTIATRQLAVSGPETSDNHYTFITPDVYMIRIVGTSKHPRAFQPFTLDYEVRVTNGTTTAQPIPPILWAGIGLVIGLVLLAAYATNSTNEQQDWRKKRI